VSLASPSSVRKLQRALYAKAKNLSHKVGNLGLTDAEEDQIVQFLKRLTDGYFVPPARPEGQPVPSATSPGK
jgi:hypothetical protein